MFGSYYQTQSTQAIEGLGDLADKLGHAEQNLHEILTGKLGFPAVPAIGVFTPWGVQAGSVNWQDLRNPESDLLVLPLNDQSLQAAQTASFGAPVGWLAVMTSGPAAMDTALRAFDDSPYGFDSAEGVYNQKDVGDPPRIRFLYWGKPREPDDGGGGRASMASVASALGGTLVFPIQIPRTNTRPHPAMVFGKALDLQLGAQFAPVPAPPGGAPPRFVAPPTASSGLPWWALLGLGAGVAWGGYKLARRLL